MFNIGSKAEQTTLLAWLVSSEDYPYLQWAIPEKIQPSRGVEWGYTFLEKNPEIFRYVILPLEILQKASFHLSKFCKIVWQLFEIPSSMSFLNTSSPGNFTCFSLNPCNFHMLFLQHPWKFHVLKPRLNFFWNSQNTPNLASYTQFL